MTFEEGGEMFWLTLNFPKKTSSLSFTFREVKDSFWHFLIDWIFHLSRRRNWVTRCLLIKLHFFYADVRFRLFLALRSLIIKYQHNWIIITLHNQWVFPNWNKKFETFYVFLNKIKQSSLSNWKTFIGIFVIKLNSTSLMQLTRYSFIIFF